MGTITSGIGLISGIQTADIIDKLMALESQPKARLQSRMDQVNSQKLAYTDLATRLSGLKLSFTALKKLSTFQKSTATSSNESVLTATTAAGAATGTFQFQVARLATTQQAVSRGLASEASKVGAGTITVEMGGGEVFSQTQLSQLNGGNGVQRGVFRITDRSGKSGLIDISACFTLDDVVRKINTSLDISVRAQIDGDRLTLTDLSGQTASNLIVMDMGDGHAAADLGIAQTAAGPITGAVINYLGTASTLASLRDGLGVRTVGGAADFRITDANGAAYDVTMGAAATVGDVLTAINLATGGAVVASIDPQSKSITLSDTTGGSGTMQVTALNGSRAAADLGIQRSAVAGVIAGDDLIATVNSVLLSSLQGGTGLSMGRISITDRAGASAEIDLGNAKTVQDVIDLINDSSVQVTASLKASGNGIQLVDESAGTGDLIIADVDDTTAATLGIAGTHAPATSVVLGANLQRQWLSENTALATMNGGKGVASGTIRITNSAGQYATVSLTSDDTTLGDLIRKINAATAIGTDPVESLNVVASINANGDGLLLTDNSAGTVGKLTVEEVGSSMAADLNIRGVATATTLDGSFEKTYTIGADDTLKDVIDDLNAPGFALSAAMINDGSGATPYRLSLTARNAGRAGRFIFDAGSTSLATHNLVESEDAAVFLGGSTGTQPLVVTSSSNQMSNIVKGVTIDLHSASASPVTLSIANDVDNVVGELNKFIQGFNELVDKLHDLTKFNSDTMARGLLLGEGTVQKIESELYAAVRLSVTGTGSHDSLMDVGLRLVDGAKLELNEEKFRAAYAADPNSVTKLFTFYQKADEAAGTVEVKGLGYYIEERLNSLIDPVSGLIARQNQALDKRNDDFQDRIDRLDKLLDAKRLRLERQFANMESVLAGLQSQQQALESFTPVSPMTNSSRK